MLLMPSVIESDGRAQKAFDLPSKLFDENIILLENGINDDLAAIIKMPFLFLSLIITFKHRWCQEY